MILIDTAELVTGLNVFPPFLKGDRGIFGNSNLDIVCYLLFGAWNFSV